MKGFAHPYRAGVIVVVLGIALNVFALSFDGTIASEFRGLPEVAFDSFIIGCILFSLVCLYLVLREATRDVYLNPILIVLGGWILAPAAVGLGLSGDDGVRDWTVLAWRWALEPLPIEVYKLMGWRVPQLSVSFVEGLAMVALQVASLALLVGAIGTLIRLAFPPPADVDRSENGTS